jgi:hypothetical protein
LEKLIITIVPLKSLEIKRKWQYAQVKNFGVFDLRYLSVAPIIVL